jgi:hypothetical protein
MPFSSSLSCFSSILSESAFHWPRSHHSGSYSCLHRDLLRYLNRSPEKVRAIQKVQIYCLRLKFPVGRPQSLTLQCHPILQHLSPSQTPWNGSNDSAPSLTRLRHPSRWMPPAESSDSLTTNPHSTRHHSLAMSWLTRLSSRIQFWLIGMFILIVVHCLLLFLILSLVLSNNRQIKCCIVGKLWFIFGVFLFSSNNCQIGIIMSHQL